METVCLHQGVGRPSTMLGFNPKSAYCIGMDIGGTKLLFLITDLVGNIVYEKNYQPKISLRN